MINFKSALSFILTVFLTIGCTQDKTIDGTNFIYNGKVKEVTTTYYEIENGDTYKLIKADSLRAFVSSEEFDRNGNTLILHFSAPSFKMTDEYVYESNQLKCLNETWDNGQIKKEYKSLIKWTNENEFKGINYDNLTKMTSVIHVVYNNDKSKKSKDVYSNFNDDTISRTRYIYSSTVDTNSYIVYTKKPDEEQIDTTTFITRAKDKNQNAVELIELDNNKATYYVIKTIIYY